MRSITAGALGRAAAVAVQSVTSAAPFASLRGSASASSSLAMPQPHATSSSPSSDRSRHGKQQHDHQSSSSSSSSSSWTWEGFARSGFVVAAAASAVAVGTVAAKAPDTPEYLLPYYLRSARARFNHYASVREKGGVRFMTTEDFVTAMLAAKDSSAVTEAAASELATLFKETDADGDGRISFREFSFLMILLCTKPEDFQLAFHMFDAGGRGGLTRGEFKRMIRVFGDDTMRPSMRGGLVAHIFDTGKFIDAKNQRGNAGGRRSRSSSLADEKREPMTTLDHFEKVIADLRRRILVAEFRLQDTDSTGRISRHAFGELLTNSILGRHLPFFMVDNLRRMDRDDSDNAKAAVTLDSWLVFSEMMRQSDAISEALAMYAANGIPVRRPDFHRAVRAVGCLSRPMTESEVDLVFEIFDRDGDGSLEYDEFASVMRNKASYNVVEADKSRVNLFAQFAKCAKEVVAGGGGAEGEEA